MPCSARTALGFSSNRCLSASSDQALATSMPHCFCQFVWCVAVVSIISLLKSQARKEAPRLPRTQISVCQRCLMGLNGWRPVEGFQVGDRIRNRAVAVVEMFIGI